MIASFDIGKKNFAFVIEEINTTQLQELSPITKTRRFDYSGKATSEYNQILSKVYQLGKIVLYRNLDLTIGTNKKLYLDPKIFLAMYTELEKYTEYWDKCNVILIERQMAFRGKSNPMALKLGQHCYSYFIFKYGDTKKIIEFPAYHKTQVLGAIKKLTKPHRKKWAIEKAMSILAEREDYLTLASFQTRKKLDDICDCILMNIAYTVMNYIF
jgi:hypothetical protein